MCFFIVLMFLNSAKPCFVGMFLSCHGFLLQVFKDFQTPLDLSAIESNYLCHKSGQGEPFRIL
jgi:hypothetical protein